MNMSLHGKHSPARAVALVGICAALLECVKLALMWIPNVEGVTLLVALFGYVFGIWGVISAIVFVTIEPLIFGFGAWVISYYLYWPALAFIFMLLGKYTHLSGIKERIIPTVIAVVMTLWFGVLTSAVDVGLFMGRFDNFLYRFGVMYVRGIVFYAIQVGVNLVMFPLLFSYLAGKLKMLSSKVL